MKSPEPRAPAVVWALLRFLGWCARGGPAIGAVSDEMVRASGDAVCETCGLLIRMHPPAGPEDAATGRPFCRRGCCGRLLEL